MTPFPGRASAQVSNVLIKAHVAQVMAAEASQITTSGTAIESQITKVEAKLNLEEQQLSATLKAGQDPTAPRDAISAATSLLTQLELTFSNFESRQARCRVRGHPSEARVAQRAPQHRGRSAAARRRPCYLLEFLRAGPGGRRPRSPGPPCLGVIRKLRRNEATSRSVLLALVQEAIAG